MAPVESDSETLIEPASRFQLVRWRELWVYRDLLWLLVWKEIASRYKQTLLGPVWFVIQPLLTTLVFTIVFFRVGHIGTAGIPPILFYFCGLLFWSYFSSTVTSTVFGIANNANLFSKVYFPRLIVPLAGAISNLAAFAIQAALFAAMYAAYKFTPVAASFGVSPQIVLLPLVLLQFAALSLGFGLCIAALTARYRDLGLISGFLVQLWMYATPVIYPFERIPPRLRSLAARNPAAMPAECARHLLLGGGDITAPRLALSVALSLGVLLAGLAAFSRAERNFIDIL
jgi:lipopolysaccharide transport system permease protein